MAAAPSAPRSGVQLSLRRARGSSRRREDQLAFEEEGRSTAATAGCREKGGDSVRVETLDIGR